MTALTADRETTRRIQDGGGIQSFPAGVDVIYKGSMVGVPSDGYVEALVLSTAQRFAGVAREKVDNSAGSNGAKNVEVYTEGRFKFAASSITQAMVGQMMYAVDDQTFDDVPPEGGPAIPVGVLVEYVSTTEGWIDIGKARNRTVEEIVQAVAFGDFTDGGGTSGYVDLDVQLPAGAIPIGVKYVVATGFTGDTTAVVQTGVSGDTDRFSSVTDQSVLAAATVGHGVPTDACDGMNAAQTIRVTVTGGADFTSISAGSMTVFVYFIRT